MNAEQKFKSIHDAIYENYHSYDFTIDVLCESQNISRTTLHRILKSHTGKSTANYINEIRLGEAVILLKHSELTIKEIANRVGYKDPKYFSKIFKKKYTVVPSQMIYNS